MTALGFRGAMPSVAVVLAVTDGPDRALNVFENDNLDLGRVQTAPASVEVRDVKSDRG